MCGIVGIYLKTKKYEKHLGKFLSGMLDGMATRGPDSAGFAIYTKENKNIFKYSICINDLKEKDFKIFCTEFEAISKSLLCPDDLNLIIEFDRSIPKKYLNIEVINTINSQVWGQDFPAPVFFGIFDVVKQEIIANNHNKCVLKNDYGKYDAIFFNFSRVLADRIEIIYTIEINNFNQNSSIQLIIKSENERK